MAGLSAENDKAAAEYRKDIPKMSLPYRLA